MVENVKRIKTFLLRLTILFARLKQLENTEIRRLIYRSSSEEEHKVNALALGAEEGRDKLR